MNEILIFDTETNGIGNFRPTPTQDLIQLGFIANENIEKSFIIKNTSIINPEVPHDITLEMCNNGTEPHEAIEVMIEYLKKSKVLIAHNLEFDIGIIRYALKKNKEFDLLKSFNEEISKKKLICTMKSSVDYCKILGNKKNPKDKDWYKWPKLEELYLKLFKEMPNEKLHDALEDCRVLKKCVIELLNKKQIN